MNEADQNLTRINLDQEKPESGSILVPKINVSFPSAKTPTDPVVPKKWTRSKKIWLGVGIFFLLFAIYNIVAGFLVYKSAKKLISDVSLLQSSAKEKDLGKVKTQIGVTRGDLKSFQTTYRLFVWARIVPFVGGFVADGDHAVNAGLAGLDAGSIVVGTIEPYSDLLGLSGTSQKVLAAKTGEQTTQDRIDFIVKTIPDLLPKIDSVSAKVKIVNDEISQINADRYPDTFRGKKAKSQIKSAQNTVSEVATLLISGKPLLEQAPYILGMDSPRTYLILFQNDKELRPTGGFMTAYAIMKVDKAKLQPVSSNDIYNLDAQYTPSTPAPDPIVKYIKGPYILSQNLRLRDMNWSPDFAVGMQDVMTAVSSIGMKNINGIIAVDTHLLTNLLDVIGPIGVPGFGNFSTKIDPECNCAQVIHELESFADVEGPIVWDPVSGKIVYRPPNSDNRKLIIGPLMNSILSNALGQPKDKLPSLFSAAFSSLVEKHVLLYMLDSKSEVAVSGIGIGGVINQNYNGDYLHINDANLGGRKSNLYATEEVNQDINIGRDGSVTKTVTITYKNPEKQDGWLNSVLPTWVRVYVPKGSTLIAAEGLETKADPYTDLGHTVFAGFFQLRPEGVSKITFQYKLPFKVSKEYKLLIQKQPGTDGFLYTVNIGRHTEEFNLKTDKELKIGL